MKRLFNFLTILFVILLLPTFALAPPIRSGGPITYGGGGVATDVLTDTTNFDSNLSVADTTIQLALDTLDDILDTPAEVMAVIDDSALDFGIGTLSAVSYTASDGTDPHIIKAVDEPGLGGRLTFGLDETARTLVLCEFSDIDVDFALAAAAQPTMYIFHTGAAAYLSMNYSTVFSTADAGLGLSGSFGTVNTMTVDKDLGDAFRFVSNVNIELDDTNAEQSWMYIEPKINQTNTASYNALKIEVTETGVVGINNNLIKAGTTGDDDMFLVTNGGMIRTAPETVTCVAEAGTASINIRMSYIVTDGDADTDEDTVSLGDGVVGDEKVFVYLTETDVGDTANVTPNSALGFTDILFDVPGQGCIMVYTAGGWAIVANNGGVIT